MASKAKAGSALASRSDLISPPVEARDEHRNGHGEELRELLHALQAMRAGDFSVRMTGHKVGLFGKIADTFNEIAVANQRMAQQLETVVRVVGREGEACQRVDLGVARGAWGEMETSINTMVDLLLSSASEVTRVAREVDHRAKNSLAVVQSIVRLTRADTVKAYIAAVEGRIRAISQVHSLLAETRWVGADLRRLVDDELAPYRAEDMGRIDATGPDISINPATAQALALAIHELATNAARYGALSSTAGTVKVRWTVEPAMLKFEWREIGGPGVAPPGSQGVGMRVIASSIKGQLSGEAVFDWRAEGLLFSAFIPISERGAVPDAGSLRRQEGKSAVPIPSERGKRVLLVEDEALVAMMMKDVLDDIGFSVIGPFTTPSEALRAIEDHVFDTAILDVNLGGELVYAVADVLVARAIPFLFVTGYGAESVERRFLHVPVLEKPVDPAQLQKALNAIPGHNAPPDEAGPAAMRVSG